MRHAALGGQNINIYLSNVV